VKVNRSDLLGGLRRGQLLSYQLSAIHPTHLYLAVHQRMFQGDILEELAELGLEEHWGIIKLWESQGRDRTLYVEILREPSLYKPDPGFDHRLLVIEQIAASFASRALSLDSPMSEEQLQRYMTGRHGPPADGRV